MPAPMLALTPMLMLDSVYAPLFRRQQSIVCSGARSAREDASVTREARMLLADAKARRECYVMRERLSAQARCLR